MRPIPQKKTGADQRDDLILVDDLVSPLGCGHRKRRNAPPLRTPFTKASKRRKVKNVKELIRTELLTRPRSMISIAGCSWLDQCMYLECNLACMILFRHLYSYYKICCEQGLVVYGVV